jgi:hypothetical protein
MKRPVLTCMWYLLLKWQLVKSIKCGALWIRCRCGRPHIGRQKRDCWIILHIKTFYGCFRLYNRAASLLCSSDTIRSSGLTGNEVKIKTVMLPANTGTEMWALSDSYSRQPAFLICLITLVFLSTLRCFQYLQYNSNIWKYCWSNSTKSPASGVAEVNEPRLVLHVGWVRVDRCVSVVRAVDVQVFLRIRSYSSNTSVVFIGVGGRQFVSWDIRLSVL